MELGNNNMEQFFKQSFESFQPDVDPKVWNNIQKSIGKSGNGSGSFIGSLAGKLIIGSAAVALVTVSTIMLIGNGDKSISKNKNNSSVKNSVITQNLIPVTVTLDKKTPVKPNTIKNTIPKNNVVSTRKPTINHTEKTVHPANNSAINTNTVAPSVNNVPNNTENNKSETSKPLVYADPLHHPGMNMPEKKHVNSQNTEEQAGGSNTNPTNEGTKPSGNTKIAKIDFTSSTSSTYAPLTVYFTNKGKAVSEEWSFGDGSFSRYGKNPVWVFEFPGEFTIILTATNEAGRVEKDSIKIKVKSNAFFIPNTFTPNGDGQNDIYKIIKNDNYPYELSNLEIVVYDRSNNKMATFNSSDYGWDGRSIKDGRMCGQGIYLILIKYTSSEDGKAHEERGTLFLKN